jgi:hypothetical protein
MKSEKNSKKPKVISTTAWPLWRNSGLDNLDKKYDLFSIAPPEKLARRAFLLNSAFQLQKPLSKNSAQ